VNLASRVEGLTKRVGEAILVTEATRARAGGAATFRELPAEMVRGKAEKVRIFAPDRVLPLGGNLG
jgi:adenylate cyclase